MSAGGHVGPRIVVQMPDLATLDYQFAQVRIERGIRALYLIAFLVAANQFPALLGERGLQPATRLLARTRVPGGAQPLPRGATRTGGCDSSRGPGSLISLPAPDRAAAARRRCR